MSIDAKPPKEPLVRPATVDDAPILAKLIDIAGEGIPHWLWSGMAAADQSALAVGEERARRETGGFSYRNALVAEARNEVAGMMLGYRVAEPTAEDRADVASLPEPIRPFVELEHEAAGTFYVNALAVLPGRRGAGIGGALLRAAEARARELAATRMSIQVFGQNTGAVRLYRRFGYRQTDSRHVLLHPCQPYYDGDVLLLEKDL
jgi:ribosomal protein S18 acetylase RimI-like enzyme